MTDSNIDQLQGIRNNILENVNNPDLLKWFVNDLDTLIYKIKQVKNYDSLDNVSVSSFCRLPRINCFSGICETCGKTH